MTNTAPSSRQDIQREVDDLKQDWQQYTAKVTETKSKLEKCMKQWQDYEAAFEKLTQWLKVMERKVKDFAPVSTVQEKQAQLAKYQVSQDLFGVNYNFWIPFKLFHYIIMNISYLNTARIENFGFFL